MDLSLLNTKDASEEGRWLPLLDLDWKTPLGIEFKVLGPDSDEAAAIALEEERTNQRKLADIFSGTQKKDEAVESSDSREIRKCARLVVDWRGEVIWGDKGALGFNKENLNLVISKVPHIRRQVIQYYNDRANFTSAAYRDWKKQSSLPSASTTPEEKAAR